MLFRLSFSFALLAAIQLLAPSIVLSQYRSTQIGEFGESNKARAAERGENAPRTRPLRGPVLGYVFDPVGHRFRPILGIPGASIVGRPLNLALPVENAIISPGQEFALGMIGSDRIPAVLRFSEDSASILWIEGALPAPTGIFLSPSGTAAVLYYAEEQKVQVVTGLPSSPSVVRETSLARLPSELTALAVSDDAAALLLGFSEDGSGSVFLLTADGAEQFVLGLGHASAITFLARSNDALITDSETDKVYMLKKGAGIVETFVFADARDGLSAPSVVAVTEDNRWAFVLNSGRGRIVGLDLAGGPPRLLFCSCQPSGLHRLIGSSVFRLTEPSTGPMWLLDADAPESRLVFVPTGRLTLRATPPRVREKGVSQ